MRIDRVNQRAEFTCQHHCLPTRAATRVYDDVEFLLWKEAQDVQGMDVATRPLLLHAAEEEVD